MSRNAQVFAEGYRERPLEVEERLGVTHLVPGQHEAIWTDAEQTVIELSYVHQLGHSFIVVMIDGESLEPMAMLEAGIFGVQEKPVPSYFRLSEKMTAAIAKLKTKDVAAA